MQTILIVDDDLATRAALRIVLEEEGYHVAEAANGEVALDILTTAIQTYVVLFDMMMPHYSGLEMMGFIERHPLLQAHAYVLVTIIRHPIAGEVERLLHSLNIPVIRKPLDIDEVLTTVRTLVSHKQALA